MADVRLIGLSKRFRDGTDVLLDLNLDIADGEFLVLVGPSGCGKTTALRMIAGLADITVGEIRIGGRLVNHVPPSKRDIVMVFQNYALYPHMTVRKNLEIGLKLRGVSKPERETKVRETVLLSRHRGVPRAQAGKAVRWSAPTRGDGSRLSCATRRCSSSTSRSRTSTRSCAPKFVPR